MFLVLSLFCEYVLYIFLIMLVLSEVSENRVGLNARRKEISNLEIWKFSVNPNEHRIYSLKKPGFGVLRVLCDRAVCITVQ